MKYVNPKQVTVSHLTISPYEKAGFSQAEEVTRSALVELVSDLELKTYFEKPASAEKELPLKGSLKTTLEILPREKKRQRTADAATKTR